MNSPQKPHQLPASIAYTELDAALPKDQGRTKSLEIRPPAAVSIGTRLKGRGRTGSAMHGSFSLFQTVLKRRVNDKQTKVTITADRENPSYFLRSVV
jgi:hypothetical protein